MEKCASHLLYWFRKFKLCMKQVVSIYPRSASSRGGGALKYNVVSRRDPRISQIYPKQVFSQGAKVHPKCLFHPLPHNFHPLNKLRNQLKPKGFWKRYPFCTLFVENSLFYTPKRAARTPLDLKKTTLFTVFSWSHLLTTLYLSASPPSASSSIKQPLLLVSTVWQYGVPMLHTLFHSLLHTSVWTVLYKFTLLNLFNFFTGLHICIFRHSLCVSWRFSWGPII